MPKSKVPKYRWVPPAQNAFQLKITLRYIKPLIWRRVVVPDNYTLGELHPVIQPAMGWLGGHMHAFRFGGGFRPVEYAAARTVEDCGPSIQDEDTVFLSQVIRRKGQTFTYEYDFGDGWLHEVKVEKIDPFHPGLRVPVCLAGERACPPEDCGGVPGYYDVLRVLKETSTPQDRELREWLGSYDPDYFDLERVNRRLQPQEVSPK